MGDVGSGGVPRSTFLFNHHHHLLLVVNAFPDQRRWLISSPSIHCAYCWIECAVSLRKLSLFCAKEWTSRNGKTLCLEWSLFCQDSRKMAGTQKEQTQHAKQRQHMSTQRKGILVRRTPFRGVIDSAVPETTSSHPRGVFQSKTEERKPPKKGMQKLC